MRRNGGFLFPLLIVWAAVAAYSNSFSAPFLFDDYRSIVLNPSIHTARPLWNVVSGTTRPILQLTLAVNYAIGRSNVWGYHAVNLAIHTLAALTLFGVVRRTFQGRHLKARYGEAASGLALAVALLWVVHPLHTQSVTYIIQRSEALMGLFYLLTLYGVIREAQGPQRQGWGAGAVVSCILGMGSKPVMVTAPVLIALYDRVFLAGSFREALRQRRGLYLGLASTWGILAVLLMTVRDPYQINAGFRFHGATPLEYALTQPGVILHYLRLAFWPKPLVFYYEWPLAKSWGAIGPPTAAVLGLGLLTLWAMRRHPQAGFVGAWFFLILSPSSSVIPIADSAFEYRMYLPLAAVIVAAVLGGEFFLRRLFPLRKNLRRALAMGLVLSSVTPLAWMTLERNALYQSEVGLWGDTVTKRPKSHSARCSLGEAFYREGKLEEAALEYLEALRLAPDCPQAHHNLGSVLAREGRWEEAIVHYREAIRLDPGYAQAHENLGLLLGQQGKKEEAAVHFLKARQLKPDQAWRSR